MMLQYLNLLEEEFKNVADLKTASQQKAYMRNQFHYFGLKTPIRRVIQKPFLESEHLPKRSELKDLIVSLWEKPEREFQHFGQELVFKYVKNIEVEDVVLYEYMITQKSWWDTVDFIATKLVAAYFKIFPEQKEVLLEKWVMSNNIWLQRTALIFQLKYKKDTDTKTLRRVITSLLDSKEFFINKAIGWVLREYSRTNPKWVVDFTKSVELSPLSKREALRLIK